MAEPGVAAQIAIAVARTAWKLGAVVIAFAVAVTVLASRSAPAPEYEASALVVANELAIRPESLPRFAEAVFRGGTVAEEATSGRNALPFSATELIPERARLEPFENTVIIAVVGTAADPQLAADIANRVADDFVGELAKVGPGVGVFSVQDAARPPEDPLPRTSVVTSAVVGLVGGAALAAGLLALWMTARRPVLTPPGAARATGVPLIASLALARVRRGSDAWTEPAPATASVARQLFPDLAGMAALVATAGAESERTRVAAMVARVLAHSTSVHLVSSSGPLPGDAPVDGVVVTTEVPSGRVWSVSPVLVDGPTEYDLPLLAPPNGRIALVVAEGSPRVTVERAAAQFPTGELFGVVFTYPQRGLRRPT